MEISLYSALNRLRVRFAFSALRGTSHVCPESSQQGAIARIFLAIKCFSDSTPSAFPASIFPPSLHPSLPPSFSPALLLSLPPPARPGRTRAALARAAGALPFRRVARRWRWPWRSTTSRRSRWFRLPRYSRAAPLLPRPSVPSAPGHPSRSSRSAPSEDRAALLPLPRCRRGVGLRLLPLPREPWTRPC